jgi:hypothetical protein
MAHCCAIIFFLDKEKKVTVLFFFFFLKHNEDKTHKKTTKKKPKEGKELTFKLLFWRAPKSWGETQLRVSQSQVAEIVT